MAVVKATIVVQLLDDGNLHVECPIKTEEARLFSAGLLLKAMRAIQEYDPAKHGHGLLVPDGATAGIIPGGR